MAGESNDSDYGSAYRGLMIAALALVACILAVWIGLMLSRVIGPASWISATFLVAGLLLLAWSLILFALLIPALLRFVRCGAIEDLPVGALLPSFVFFAALVLLAAFGGRSTAGGRHSSVTITTMVMPMQADGKVPMPPVTEGPIEPARDFFMVPFYTDEGRSKTCTEDDPAFGNAQNVHEGSKPVLRVLVEGLKECAAQGKTPEIDVRGFASSSGFKNCTGVDAANGRKTSDELNLLLSERRRASVIRAVREIDPLGLIRIYQENEPRRWPTIDEMRRNVRIVDSNPDGSYSTLRGNLSRRAEIVITDKGDCEETIATVGPPAAASPTQSAIQ
ncbi:hypothetical protein [Sphingobium sp. Ndbn-10]|uniref:hypothetical protein n=1 Tax=Sphingobium sp. Ndbn-10 TaxID=1667223 RepID=UPI001111F53E|nr:hypothetical protein [Sphingobium sp. Ndbn-10]